MSSISLDASGARAITTTINDQARTFASIPTKAGDDVTVYGGNVKEFSILVNETTKVKVLRKPDGSQAIFIKTGSLSVTGYNKGEDEDGPPMFPHMSVSVRKGMENPYADAEVVQEVTLGEALGLTEEA